jgi:hypothetical protein
MKIMKNLADDDDRQNFPKINAAFSLMLNPAGSVR